VKVILATNDTSTRTRIVSALFKHEAMQEVEFHVAPIVILPRNIPLLLNPFDCFVIKVVT
jgi:hypothetical protein